VVTDDDDGKKKFKSGKKERKEPVPPVSMLQGFISLGTDGWGHTWPTTRKYMPFLIL